MADPTHDQKPGDPTADYREYPKGPSFLNVVLMACAALLVVLVVGYLIVHHAEKKIPAHAPDPTPNSMIQPATPRPIAV